MHTTGGQGLKSVDLVVKMCTQGAGCTLKFEHWRHIAIQSATLTPGPLPEASEISLGPDGPVA